MKNVSITQWTFSFQPAFFQLNEKSLSLFELEMGPEIAYQDIFLIGKKPNLGFYSFICTVGFFIQMICISPLLSFIMAVCISLFFRNAKFSENLKKITRININPISWLSWNGFTIKAQSRAKKRKSKFELDKTGKILAKLFLGSDSKPLSGQPHEFESPTIRLFLGFFGFGFSFFLSLWKRWVWFPRLRVVR